MPNDPVTMLREAYERLCTERSNFLEEVNERVLAGGQGFSAEERERSQRMATEIDEAKEQYEAHRDLTAQANGSLSTHEAEGEIEAAQRAAGGDTLAMTRDMAGAVGGREAVEAYDRRSGEVMDNFARMSNEGQRNVRIDLNPHLARNFRMLQDLGVSPGDYVSAIRSGQFMMAERSDNGSLDVRFYGIAQNTYGQQLIPTFWDNVLYEFASYIGGVQSSGAEVIPVMGNNTLKLLKVTGFADGLDVIANEGTTLTTETLNTTGTVDLTPRPYRGFAAETDEIMRSAAIDVRLMLVMRGLSRALQLGKEDDFHEGNGTNKPTGILNSPPAAMTQKTGGDTTGIRYQDIPGALGKLDAEYHAGMRAGEIVSLMHSQVWFDDFVGKVISFTGNTGASGMPLYPHLAQGAREIFGTRLNFSHKMDKTAAADKYLAVVGNFRDFYVIATVGGLSIEVTDDFRFLDFERVYRIQEYCDGQIRDAKAAAFVQSAD